MARHMQRTGFAAGRAVKLDFSMVRAATLQVRHCFIRETAYALFEDALPAKHLLPKPGDGGFMRSNFVKTCSKRSLHDTYEIKGKLGEGAFGAVQAAKHRHTAQEVAIKAVPKSSVEDLGVLKAEAELLRVTDHPHIARLYEVFEGDTSFYFVMELCSGGELWERILFAHDCFALGFTERELASAMQQMLRAVGWCHAHNIVHRDLKPQNFLLASSDPDARLKLVDFGISGVVPPGLAGSRYLSSRAGTEGYMAPEILLSRPYGPPADLFSLGAIMHAAVVGLPPRWDQQRGYSFPGRVRLQSLSSEARDLFGRLVDCNPCARPTAADALKHPWFQMSSSMEPDGSKPLLDAECLVRMRRFGKRSKLQKAAMTSTIAFASLRREEMAALQATFLAVDRDGSGEVTTAELAAALQGGSHEVELLMEGLDSSKDGKISYTEWLAGTASRAWFSTCRSARQAFDSLDDDGDGSLGPSELLKALPGVFQGEEEMLEEIRRLDKDGDGLLDFDEFCALLQAPSHELEEKC
eukprot:TRINITY_DN59103_c0_g1_i1.p1 TRINITY_DN59103_c0_g1~~TRINITY_DN59103_c0_g1_i1.p1  ORF type:complete len:542 (+),score=99.84 TRINITY_DN59103_c0_g1_i1:52-1626(+)